MENKVHVKNIMEAVKEKLKAMEFRLNNVFSRFETIKGCLKEWKVLLLLSPSPWFEEEVVKRG